MIQITDKYGNIVHQFSSLRGLRKKLSDYTPISVELTDEPPLVKINCINGHICTTPFASFNVMICVVSNWNKLQGTTVYLHGKQIGKLDRQILRKL